MIEFKFTISEVFALKAMMQIMKSYPPPIEGAREAIESILAKLSEVEKEVEDKR